MNTEKADLTRTGCRQELDGQIELNEQERTHGMIRKQQSSVQSEHEKTLNKINRLKNA